VAQGPVVELIAVDVRDGSAEDLTAGEAFANFDSRVIRFHEKMHTKQQTYWRSFVVAGHLPGFSIAPCSLDAASICGTKSGLSFSRFTTFASGNLNALTPAGRVITSALMESLWNVNFQFGELFKMRSEFFNMGLVTGLNNGHVADICELASNYESNMSSVGLTDVGIGRLAVLTLPFVRLTSENPQRITAFLADHIPSPDYDAFTKLSVFRVQIDRCPLAVWFWVGHHALPAELVFRAVVIASAFLTMSRIRDAGQWIFTHASDSWREAIALLPPQVCAEHLSSITSLPVLRLLEDEQFNISHADLLKMVHYCGAPTFTAQQLREDLYHYITKSSNPTLEGFRQLAQSRYGRKFR
jgi:hypothetical protein